MRSRREFLVLSALGVAGCTVRRGTPLPGGSRLLHVGTYTNDGRSQGIYAVRMNEATGELTLAGVTAQATNPSFLVPSRDGRFVYAVNETTEYEGEKSGAVSGFARGATGELALVARQPSRGGAPCYISLDRGERYALVANYVGGSVAVFPLDGRGGLGPASAFVQHEGRGPNAQRQEGPHAHSIMVDATNQWALAADLGLDRIFIYRFDQTSGTLIRAGEGVLAPGAGPRHFVFNQEQTKVYVVNELNSTLTVFSWDVSRGTLGELQTVTTLPEPFSGQNSPADIHLHPSGRFLYMSNRGQNSIVAYTVGAGGLLAPLQTISTGGNWPRNFAIDPSGRFLFVANQRSDSIVGFTIDASTGRLKRTGEPLSIPLPVCLRFAPSSA